jgi:hypothetical protein
MLFARISYNENSWKRPSGRLGKCSTGIPFPEYYEQLNYFGWEEWNASEDRNHQGYQYGFLQAINSNDHLRGQTFNNIILFTRECNPHDNIDSFYIVGFIKELETLTFTQGIEYRKKIANFDKMLNDVISVQANKQNFNNDFNTCINMRYKLNEKSGYFWDKIPKTALIFSFGNNFSFGNLHKPKNKSFEGRVFDKISEIMEVMKGLSR